jgi:serine/threonine protein kinase
MELVDGLSLGEYISYLKENNIYMKEELIIKIILQIVSGLRHMHKSAHVIFRDLNPNNIMLDYSFNVKLIDFGLAVEQNENMGKVNTLLNQSVQTVFEGSVLYSSPEVMENDIITYESDIWALGCIIYEMIKLRPPFIGDNPLTIAKNVCEGNYEKLDENDFKTTEIINLVNACLIVDWKQRIKIDEVCQILGPFLFDYISGTKSKETQLQREIMDLI